jgi:hypothetical protein
MPRFCLGRGPRSSLVAVGGLVTDRGEGEVSGRDDDRRRG